MEPSDTAPAPALPARTPLQQHPFYGAALARLGVRTERLSLPCGAGPPGWAQIVHRRIGPLRLAWLPRGPLWPERASAAEQSAGLDTLRERLARGTLLLRAGADTAPPASAAGGDGVVLAPGRAHAWLDLTGAKPERLAAQHGKWRNRLRFAERQGLSVTRRPFDTARDLPLLRLEMDQRRARRYRALPPGFTLAWAMAQPESVQLFLARRGTTLVAFLLILVHPPSASYHIGWTSPAGRAAAAHNLLLWRASNWLSSRGIGALDLGLCDAQTAPGLAHFKRGTGAEVLITGPTRLSLPRLGRRRAEPRAA